jgi:predicted metal-dependent hydrolase
MTLKDFSDSSVLVATLAKGIEEFNTHRFFECHETLEDIWRAERRPLRQFYKGVIQVAAGFHHLGRNNWKGTVNKLESGTRYLEPFRPRYLGLDVQRLIDEARGCRSTILELGRERIAEFDRSRIPTIAFDEREAAEEAARLA